MQWYCYYIGALKSTLYGRCEDASYYSKKCERKESGHEEEMSQAKPK